MEKNNFIAILKGNAVSLKGNLEIKNFQSIKNNINIKNVATYYQIAEYFSFTKLAQLILCYIERSFTSVCETSNFFKLDLTMITKILARSELHVDSELEVLDAAES